MVFDARGQVVPVKEVVWDLGGSEGQYRLDPTKRTISEQQWAAAQAIEEASVMKDEQDALEDYLDR